MTAHDELRARALAATPGPWAFTNYEGSTHVWCGRAMSSMVADNHTEGAVCRVRGVGAGLPIMENAAFIAAASPDVVLALLDEIAALRDRDEARAEIVSTIQGFAMGAERRHAKERTSYSEGWLDAAYSVLDCIGAELPPRQPLPSVHDPASERDRVDQGDEADRGSG